MNFQKIVLTLICLLSISYAQALKIGYTNIEYVLAFMPETKQMETVLKSYEEKLGQQLGVKQQYAQGKLESYYKMVDEKKLTPAQDEEMKKELIKLDEEIKKFSAEAESQIMGKREELLKPISDKLQKAIDEIAKEGAYTYILNNTNSAGVSTILHGPESDNITEKLVKKMGITIPVATDKKPGTTTPGNK